MQTQDKAAGLGSSSLHGQEAVLTVVSHSVIPATGSEKTHVNSSLEKQPQAKIFDHESEIPCVSFAISSAESASSETEIFPLTQSSSRCDQCCVEAANRRPGRRSGSEIIMRNTEADLDMSRAYLTRIAKQSASRLSR